MTLYKFIPGLGIRGAHWCPVLLPFIFGSPSLSTGRGWILHSNSELPCYNSNVLGSSAPTQCLFRGWIRLMCYSWGKYMGFSNNCDLTSLGLSFLIFKAGVIIGILQGCCEISIRQSLGRNLVQRPIYRCSACGFCYIFCCFLFLSTRIILISAKETRYCWEAPQNGILDKRVRPHF